MRISGQVLDSLVGKPLPRANILIKEGANVRFTTTNLAGFYEADIAAGKTYSLSISYIGYYSLEKEISTQDQAMKLDLRLIPKSELLQDIVVTHRYAPITISKDTISFKADAFRTGTERKLKDLLEKLPGMEVDDAGMVRFQGKPVKVTTVASKTFFGGGSKLAIDNIPADAVEDVQMIDNFHEVDFMKDLVESDRLAMNITLKKDKQEFLFGDVELELGPEKRYLGRSGTFYYSPKNSGGLISNFNTIARPPLSRQEITLLDGGVETQLSNRRPRLFNLEELGADRDNVFQRRDALVTGNAHLELSKQLKLEVYLLDYRPKSSSSLLERIDLFDNTEIIPEQRKTDATDRNNLTAANMRFEFGATRHRRTYYGANIQHYRQNSEGKLHSISNQGDTQLGTSVANKGLALKQLFEQYRNYTVSRSSTLMLNHSYEHTNPRTSYTTRDQFFELLPPVETDTLYRINSYSSRRSHTLTGEYTYYLLLNGIFQLHLIAESEWQYALLRGGTEQALSDGRLHNFSGFGYGNDLQHRLIRNSLGTALKINLGRWTNTITLQPMWLKQQIQASDTTLSRNQLLLAPKLTSKLEFSNGGRLNLNYNLGTTFPRLDDIATGASLSAYNLIKQGNSALFYELYHNLSLNYQRFKLATTSHFFTNFTMQLRENTIRHAVDYSGILQQQSAFMSDHPAYSIILMSNYGRRYGAFRPSLSARIHAFQYDQKINGQDQTVDQLNYMYQFGLRYFTRTRGALQVQYRYSSNSLRGLSKTQFSNRSITAQLDLRLSKQLLVKPVYSLVATRFVGQSDEQYHGLDLAVQYQLGKRGWSAIFDAYNLLDKSSRYQSRLGDYYRMESETRVMPRVWLLGIGYQL